MDITSKVVFSLPPAEGAPYLRTEGPEAEEFLYGILPVGRVAGIPITIATGTVTVPRGTILLFKSSLRLVKIEFKEQVTIDVAANHTLYIAEGFDGKNHKVILDEKATASVPAGVLVLGTATGADTFVEDGQLTRLSPKKYFMQERINTNTDRDYWLVIPAGGIITGFRVIKDSAQTAESVVKLKNTLADIENASITVTAAGAAGDIVLPGTPITVTAGKVAAGSVVAIDCNGGNTADEFALVVIEITQE